MRPAQGHLAALLLLAVAACAEAPRPGAPRATDPVIAAPTVAAPAAASVSGAPGDGAPLVATPPAPPAGLGRALGGLVPPGLPGASVTRVEGCAAGEAPRAPTRGPADPASDEPTLQVTATGLGLIVTHRVEHACCLTFEVTTSLVGTTLELRERPLGTACRCRCGSTLRTTIGLPPGDYQLRLLGAEGLIEERPVHVGGLGG